MHRSRPVQLSESSSLANEALQNRALDLRPPSSATTIPSRLTERQRAFFHSTCSGLSISAVIRSALALILLGSESMEAHPGSGTMSAAQALVSENEQLAKLARSQEAI